MGEFTLYTVYLLFQNVILIVIVLKLISKCMNKSVNWDHVFGVLRILV